MCQQLFAQCSRFSLKTHLPGPQRSLPIARWNGGLKDSSLVAVVRSCSGLWIGRPRTLGAEATWQFQRLGFGTSLRGTSHLCTLQRRNACVFLGRCHGEVLATFTRQVIQDLYPRAVLQDPECGLDCNGNQRRNGSERYDFLWLRERVEVKSSLLTYDTHMRRWGYHLRSIKLR